MVLLDREKRAKARFDNIVLTVRTVIAEARGDYTPGADGFKSTGVVDFGRVKCLKGVRGAEAVLREVRKMNDEMEALTKPLPWQHASGGESLGAKVAHHAGLRDWIKAGAAGVWSESLDVLPSEALGRRTELKTLFQTTAGFPPFSPRTDLLVPAVTRPLQITDILPTRSTESAKVVFMQETTRTHASVEKAEGAAFPESTFELTEASSDVRKIADSLPVTDEQLEDEAQAEAFIDTRLRFGVLQRLDGQILNGDGIAPNLEGILNTTGIQTQARGADQSLIAIRKGITLVQVTGRAMPTHIILHPDQAQSFDLTQTADGAFSLTMPGQPGAEAGTIWRLPVVISDAIATATALVGSFLEPWITFWERRGIVVEIGFVGTQFTEGKKTVRATGRWALVVGRPAAFCTVTGLL